MAGSHFTVRQVVHVDTILLTASSAPTPCSGIVPSLSGQVVLTPRVGWGAFAVGASRNSVAARPLGEAETRMG